MRIGFDAKRAFNNYSGLGNYSRYVISNICRFYPENECLLYTPSIADEDLFQVKENNLIKLPGTRFGRNTSSYWRSFRLGHQLEKDAVDIYHGLSNELPFGIHKSKTKSILTIHATSSASIGRPQSDGSTSAECPTWKPTAMSSSMHFW